MIVHNVEQNSDAWVKCRLGIPTASAFDRILTPTGKASTQAEAYSNELLAEYLTSQPRGYEEGAGFQGNAHTERGHQLEAEARAFAELERGYKVETVGFVTTDEGLIGCSPDGLVGDEGLLEIKCPAPWTHVEYLLGAKVPTKYYPQVQGQMYVAERQWCDFISYHPLLPPVLLRVERDEEYIAKLTTALTDFNAKLEAKRAVLAIRGIRPLT